VSAVPETATPTSAPAADPTGQRQPSPWTNGPIDELPIEDARPEPTVFPTAAPAFRARRAPVRLVIPRVGVDASIVPVGTTADGRLATPGDYSSVGWYQLGPVPGERGRAVLAGHLDSRSGPAVFYRLAELMAGDEVELQPGGSGGRLTFVVRETFVYRTDEVPLEMVFGTSDRRELVLITCEGPFDAGAGGYLQRRIVIAELSGEHK
jgi:LPXTG-site transpeptidase (sortase) family protein